MLRTKVRSVQSVTILVRAPNEAGLRAAQVEAVPRNNLLLKAP